MARTELTVYDIARHGAAVEDIDDNFAAADTVNGNMFPIETDTEGLLIQNDDAGQQTVTVTSVADSSNRTASTAQQTITLAAGKKGIWHCPKSVWAQKTGADRGKVYIDGSSANLKFYAFRLPRS